MKEVPLLEMRGISKSFPGVRALDGVSLTVRAGEVHALLGENGAGKSTLIKILGGIHQADTGEIQVHGQPVQIKNVDGAKAAGIRVVHQELCLCPNMTVAENIFLGAEQGGGGFCDDARMCREAEELMMRFGMEVSGQEPLSSLSIAQQQMVELAKAISADARIIVMDEPTDTLTDKEIQGLFRIIRALKEQGVGIIYISHRMEEIFELADTITVLRDGQLIGTVPGQGAEYGQLIGMMIGREMEEMFAAHGQHIGDTLLEAREIISGTKVRGCSFQVRAGEILGFYGLVGSGRTELMRAVFGVDRMDGGEVRFQGEPRRIRRVRDALGCGINMVPENRKEQGLVLIQDVAFNVTFGVLDRLYRGLRYYKGRASALVEEYIGKLSIKTPSAAQPVLYLSGGNQQKVVLAKALATGPKLLILDEPTRGIDVGAKHEIYEIMQALAAQGVAIIMITSELPEVINMSDRVLVMYEGRITGELEGEQITQENIIIKATGGGK